jgi:hypothetical protein
VIWKERGDKNNKLGHIFYQRFTILSKEKVNARKSRDSYKLVIMRNSRTKLLESVKNINV